VKSLVYKKDVVGWCLYDWANSAFAVAVLSGFFPILFRMYWNLPGDSAFVTARLGMGDSIAGLIIACLSPVLGAFADVGRMKKSFLAFFLIIGAASTALLFFVGAGLWITALFIFILANIGFTCGNLFYDSLLVDVSEEKNMDFVSSLGYATGYVGGGLLFLFDVILVTHAKQFGIQSQAIAIRISFISVAVWWIVFSIPMFSYVTERKPRVYKKIGTVVSQGFLQLAGTAKKIVRNKVMLLFLLAFWLYMDGVYTFIMMAVNFGMSLGFKPTVLMIALLLVQFVAFPAAIGFGYLPKLIGTIPSIFIGLMIYLFVCIFGSFMLHTSRDFLVLSAFIALAQGGVQALSRSYFAKIVPQTESAEYFGFLNVVGKFSTIIGPVLVGGVTVFAQTHGMETQKASRTGMSSIAIVFILGGILLLFAEQARKRSVQLS